MRAVAGNSSIVAAVNNHYTKEKSSHSATTTPTTTGASPRLDNPSIQVPVWHYNGLSTAANRWYFGEQKHYMQSHNQGNQNSDSYILMHLAVICTPLSLSFIRISIYCDINKGSVILFSFYCHW